jgi:nitric oxide reductase subunit C
MTKREARLFAVVSTAISVLVFLALTVDSHRQFPKLTNEENLTPEVVQGQDVWHKYNCINCHTLFGEGAYYAPDLTKIAQLRGAPYLKAYMRDPSKFYDEQRHRRLMPTQNLADDEIDHLISFLDWVSRIDNQGWPPRPILVSGATIPGTDMPIGSLVGGGTQPESGTEPPGARPTTGSENPAAIGERLFRTVAPACNACHSIAPGVNMAGPSLAGVASRAEQRIASSEYKGKAKDAAGYIHEAIVDPSAYLVPGEMYSAGGTSFMPNTYGKDLTPEQIDQIVDYLITLR